MFYFFSTPTKKRKRLKPLSNQQFKAVGKPQSHHKNKTLKTKNKTTTKN